MPPNDKYLQMGIRIGLGVLGVLIVFALWALIARYSNWAHTSSHFPTPYETLMRMKMLFISRQELNNTSIYDHVLTSLRNWGIGYLIAVIIGIGAGALMGASEKINQVFMPTVQIVQLIPGLAWIPIALLLFGLNERSTVFMIAITAVAPIAINTAGGMKSVPDIYRRTAKVMGCTVFDRFIYVTVPASTLPILNGLRIGLANGWRVLIAAEMVLGLNKGLGYSIIQARWSLDYEAAFVCIVVICVIGLFFEKVLFANLERFMAKRMGMTEGI